MKKFLLDARKNILNKIKYGADTSLLKYVNKDFRKDRKFMLDAVKLNGFTLEFASNELKKNKEIVYEAVKRNGKLIGWSFVSQGDPNSYTINLVAACTASGVARSTVRCYDNINDGSLKSVALLYGSISSASTSSINEDETS